MSKMGQYVFEMQEDAYEMSETDFVKKHGKQNRDIYEQINGPDSPEPDPTEVDPSDYYISPASCADVGF